MATDSKKSFKIAVKVLPNASKNQIVEVEPEQIKVKIAAVPEDGKANKALVKYLKKTLKPAHCTVELCFGQTSRNKIIQISGIDQESFLEKLSPSV